MTLTDMKLTECISLREKDATTEPLMLQITEKSVYEFIGLKSSILRQFISVVFQCISNEVQRNGFVSPCVCILFVWFILKGFIKTYPLWGIQSKQNFVWKNGPFLAALAGLNFKFNFQCLIQSDSRGSLNKKGGGHLEVLWA